MFSKTYSAGVLGIEGFIVEVETDISGGFPQYSLVGLPDSAVRESKERVRAAIVNSGFEFPIGRITVNLAPAHLRKHGSAFDLALASGILSASGQWSIPQLEHTLLIGALSLDGGVKPVQGILPMALAAKEHGFAQIAVPASNAYEAALSGLPVYVIHHLRDAPSLFHQPVYQPFPLPDDPQPAPEFMQIAGHPQAKRALELSAAGFHNILLIGPPGTGKTMLASSLPAILPPLSHPEWLEVTKIYSVGGKHAPSYSMKRPFRSPHHSITPVGLIGGGNHPTPGELTYAHHGVLYLDEICEFPRYVLELLRQPLEERKIALHRHRSSVTFPASFILAASMNPCPCGYFGFENEAHSCKCSSVMIERYRKRISGPLMDRFDIQIHVPRLGLEDFIQPTTREDSPQEMRERVARAAQTQEERFGRQAYRRNADMTPSEIDIYCKLSPPAKKILSAAYEKLYLSHRSYHRILKLARTAADLDGRDRITEMDVAEAIQFRTLEKIFL